MVGRSGAECSGLVFRVFGVQGLEPIIRWPGQFKLPASQKAQGVRARDSQRLTFRPRPAKKNFKGAPDDENHCGVGAASRKRRKKGGWGGFERGAKGVRTKGTAPTNILVFKLLPGSRLTPREERGGRGAPTIGGGAPRLIACRPPGPPLMGIPIGPTPGEGRGTCWGWGLV